MLEAQLMDELYINDDTQGLNNTPPISAPAPAPAPDADSSFSDYSNPCVTSLTQGQAFIPKTEVDVPPPVPPKDNLPTFSHAPVSPELYVPRPNNSRYHDAEQPCYFTVKRQMSDGKRNDEHGEPPQKIVGEATSRAACRRTPKQSDASDRRLNDPKRRPVPMISHSPTIAQSCFQK